MGPDSCLKYSGKFIERGKSRRGARRAQDIPIKWISLFKTPPISTYRICYNSICTAKWFTSTEERSWLKLFIGRIGWQWRRKLVQEVRGFASIATLSRRNMATAHSSSKTGDITQLYVINYLYIEINVKFGLWGFVNLKLNKMKNSNLENLSLSNTKHNDICIVGKIGENTTNIKKFERGQNLRY